MITIDDKTQMVFLEYLVKGMVDLYYCDIDTHSYYFFEKYGKMVEITKRKDRVLDNKAVPDNKYRGMVIYYFKEYPSIVKSTDKMSFDQKSFINIAKLYHDETCTTGEECIIYVNKRPDESSVALKFSIYAGIQLGTYTLVRNYPTTTEFDLSSTQPVIGGKMNVYNPRWSKSLSLQLDLSLSRFDSDGEEIYRSSTRSYEFKSMLISGKLGFEYKLPLKKVRPKIGTAFVYTKLFSDDGKYYISEQATTPTEYKLRKSYVGYSLNLGVDYVLGKGHAVFLQGSMERYTKSDATENHGRDTFGSYNLIVGYTF